MKRPLSPWIVTSLSLVAVLVALVVVVIVSPNHPSASNYDDGEQLGQAFGKVAFLIAGSAYFVQRHRVKRFEESQVRGRSV